MTSAPPLLTRFALAAALAALSIAAPAADAQAQDGRRKQEIIFGEIAEHAATDRPFTVAARASSGLPVVLVVVSGPAVMDGKLLRLTGSTGLVIVRASQDGNDAFLPARIAERAFSVHGRPAAPSITRQPSGTDAAVGEPLILTAAASGEPPPAYQWRRDGQPVTGADGPTLSIGAVQPADAGAYDVVATNSAGSATSQAARVRVGRHRQTITFQSSSAALVAGQPVSLNAYASSGLPVTFTVVSGSGFVSGNILTSSGTGSVLVQATQAGDTGYEAADPVTQSFIFSPSAGQSLHP